MASGLLDKHDRQAGRVLSEKDASCGFRERRICLLANRMLRLDRAGSIACLWAVGSIKAPLSGYSYRDL